MQWGMAARLARGVSLLVWVGACGGPSRQAGAGEQCFRVTDCELGLICGPDQKCTSDLTAIDIRPDASQGGGGAGGVSGGSPDSSSSTASGGAAGMSTGAGGASAAGSAGTSAGGSDADAAD